MSELQQSEMDRLKDRLYGPDGIGVTNVGITRGLNPNVTPEQIAGEMNRALDALADGDFEIIADIGE